VASVKIIGPGGVVIPTTHRNIGNSSSYVYRNFGKSSLLCIEKCLSHPDSHTADKQELPQLFQCVKFSVMLITCYHDDIITLS
jgi:hypothetical protein